MSGKDGKLALFLPSLRGGGAERVMVNLARGFAERGLRVDLVLAKAEGPYLSQVPQSVRVVDLKSKRVLYSLPGLVRYLRRERPKALLSAMDHTNVVALWAKKLAGVPARAVVSVHSTTSIATKRAKNIRGRIMPLFIRKFYPWADAVVAVSKGVAKDLAEITGLPEERIRVIYNPVITPELFAKAEEPMDHPWFHPGEPPVILGIGRLTEAKDFPTLIRAFALVRKERPARLMILGEGEERPKLEALVRKLGLEKDVALPGFVDNPYKYMKRAALFVLSSRWEGFGNVLVEAIACSTPVVSTDCPSGPREILEDGRYGKLVPVSNPQALATAILETFANPTEKSVLKERVQTFRIHDIAQQYLDLLLQSGGEA